MSATLIHHGHIRLLKKASKYGDVIIGLSSDKDIKKYKGYSPELSYKFRKEILLGTLNDTFFDKISDNDIKYDDRIKRT